MAAPLTFAQLTLPATAYESAPDQTAYITAARLAKKQLLYNDLFAIGVTGVVSWTTGSVPSSQMEMYAWALVDYDLNQGYLALGQLNSTASGDALANLSENVYQNTPAPGTYTVCQVLLTDAANAGPYTFQPSSVSFSVGRGGLLYNGVDLLNTGLPITLPKGGSAYVFATSADVGSAYGQLSLNTLNFFARGSLPGVTVTNDSTWLTGNPQLVAGTDPQSDASLQLENSSQWGTLGTGSPALAYVNWAIKAQPTQVTRVATFTNLLLLDPGRIDVIVAGAGGAVASGVVQAVQQYIAPAQIGGSRIPDTARCVVSSAVNLTVTVSATVSIQAAYDTAAFQAQVSADFAAYAAAVPIGGGQLAVLSWLRLAEIMQYRAGLNPGIVYDVQNFSPAADVPLAYNQVPIFSLNITYVPV